MLTANQLHKQSELDMDFQDFLQKMKDAFGDNFMERVNQGKVHLKEIQNALGLPRTEANQQKKSLAKGGDSKTANSRRKAIQARVAKKGSPKAKITAKPLMKNLGGDATNDDKPKCSSCQANKDKKSATGDSKNGKAVRTFFILAGLGAVVYWAVKNRR